MDRYKIDIAEGHALVFEGEMLAGVRARNPEDDAAIELALFRNADGHYVCYCALIRTNESGETTQQGAMEVAENLDEVRRIFGDSKVARSLYAKAGIGTSTADAAGSESSGAADERS